MNIVVLGGSGFVGTRLVEILKKDHRVAIGDLVRSETYPELWKRCDVCIDDDLRSVLKGQDCIVNLAASHRDDVRPLSLYMRNNVEGAEHVCKIASELGIRLIVFTSSVAVYGFPEYEYAEDAPMHPFNEYGRTKLLAEAVYEKWQRADARNMLHVVRPTVIFGERNRGNVYNLFRQLATGRFLMVGNGRNRKSMAYVGNVVEFLKWNVEKNGQAYSVYNYIDKPDYDMNGLVNGFESILGKKLPPVSLPYWLGLLGGYCFDILAFLTRRSFPISSIRIKKFCAQTVFSSEKMLQSGFVPPYDMPEALRRTVLFEFRKD
jgi:nucleoside-diphosphate-sugar epimerase